MLDTFRLYLPQSSVPDIELVSEIPARLSIFQSHESNGKFWFSGYYKNIKWIVRKDGLSLSGNLTKLRFGNNYTNLNSTEMRVAFDELSNEFGVDLNEARVTQIDFGVNLICKYKPQLYFKYLGRSPYFSSRHINGSTLEYGNNTRRKLFYDKLKEMKAKGEAIPDFLIALKVIRFEVRYRKKWYNYFDKKSITVSDLCSDVFFKSLKERLKEEFYSIERVYHTKFNKELITKASQFKDLLVFIAINYIGLNKVYSLIDECIFLDSQNKSRVKKMCVGINCIFSKEPDYDLYDELADTFNQTIAGL